MIGYLTIVVILTVTNDGYFEQRKEKKRKKELNDKNKVKIIRRYFNRFDTRDKQNG